MEKNLKKYIYIGIYIYITEYTYYIITYISHNIQILYIYN